MGLFTQEAKTDYNVPVELRMAEDAAKSQRKFTDTYLDPAIKENIGYESPRMKMKALTSGVDLTNGKKVQETFLALQAIDPQEAQGWLQSIKPVIAQQLDSLKIKEAQLKFTKTKNKPLITQRWNLEGKGNFIKSHVATNFAGLEGAEDLATAIKAEPERADFYVNAFLNKMEKGSDKAALKAEYKAKLKKANTAYMEFWGGKDLTEKTTPTSTSKRNRGALKPTTGTVTEADVAPEYVGDPEKSQLSQGITKLGINNKIQSTLSHVATSFSTIMPNFLMTDKELVEEERNDLVVDWIHLEGFDYFKAKGAKELAKFKANPVEYYERVIKKAK
jgi:hypothetical protein